MALREHKVDRFEVVKGIATGEVMVCFMSRAPLEGEASIRLEGSDLIAEGAEASVRFSGIVPEDAESLRAAPAVFINRSSKDGAEILIRCGRLGD